VLGGNALLEEVRTQIKQGRREIIGKRTWRRRCTFQHAVAVVERHRGKSWQESKNLTGDPSREMVWWLARRHAGMTLAQLGAQAGPTDYAAVAMALKRFESKMEGNQKMKAEMQNSNAPC